MAEKTKAEVLAWMDAGYEGFRASWAGADESRMAEPALHDGWSFLDLLGHCAAWHLLSATRLRRYAIDGSLDVEGVDLSDDAALNARFVAERRGRPAPDVFAELDQSFREFREAVEGLPEESLDSESYVYFVIDVNGPGHYDEHKETVAAWMAAGA